VTVARAALSQGKRVVIDRTNFDVKQRATWVHLAHNCWPARDQTFTIAPHVWVVRFDTTRELCVQRCKANRNHPTLASTDAERVIGYMERDWVEPTLKENVDAVVRIANGDTKMLDEVVTRLNNV
jgi:predicted kinase